MSYRNCRRGGVGAGLNYCAILLQKGTTPKKPFLSSNKTKEFPIPFLKVYNLNFDGTLNQKYNPTYTTADTHSKFLKRSKVYPGDVLMNIVGPPLGKISVVPDTFNEYNINQAIVIYRPEEFMNNIYFANALLTPAVLKWALKRQKTTAGQHNLTLEICRDLPIPVPPLREQLEINKLIDVEISKFNNIYKEVTKAKDYTEQLKQSVLKSAFEGKLINE